MANLSAYHNMKPLMGQDRMAAWGRVNGSPRGPTGYRPLYPSAQGTTARLIYFRRAGSAFQFSMVSVVVFP